MTGIFRNIIRIAKQDSDRKERTIYTCAKIAWQPSITDKRCCDFLVRWCRVKRANTSILTYMSRCFKSTNSLRVSVYKRFERLQGGEGGGCFWACRAFCGSASTPRLAPRRRWRHIIATILAYINLTASAAYSSSTDWRALRKVRYLCNSWNVIFLREFNPTRLLKRNTINSSDFGYRDLSP